MTTVELHGHCYFWSETGTEGGHWAFEDERFHWPSLGLNPGSSTLGSYGGLHVLRDGDYLEIYDPDNPELIVWKGHILLRQHPLFTEDAYGLWIHTDQEGELREEWSIYFIKGYPAKLITEHEARDPSGTRDPAIERERTYESAWKQYQRMTEVTYRYGRDGLQWSGTRYTHKIDETTPTYTVIKPDGVEVVTKMTKKPWLEEDLS